MKVTQEDFDRMRRTVSVQRKELRRLNRCLSSAHGVAAWSRNYGPPEIRVERVQWIHHRNNQLQRRLTEIANLLGMTSWKDGDDIVRALERRLEQETGKQAAE